MRLYEARCACGNEWRVESEDPELEQVECLACGADVFEIVDQGVIRGE